MPILKSPLGELIPSNVESLTVTQYVTQNIQLYQDRVALIDAFSPKILKFNEFITLYRKVALGFQNNGVKLDEVVFIVLPNCIEYAILFHSLATIEIGAIMSTSNPSYTTRELEHQFVDSNAKYLITTPSLYSKLEQIVRVKNIKVFILGDTSDIPDAISYDSLLSSGDDLDELIVPTFDTKEKILVIPYSSGTTGLPKGVCLTHYNIVCNLEQVRLIESDVTVDDVFIGVLPFFHIYAIVIVLNLSIYFGVKTIIMERFDLKVYLEMIQKHKVTYLHLVPPIALAMSKHPITANYNLSSLKVIFSGAAPLAKDLQGEVKQKLGGNLVVKQAFGMTEASPAIAISPTNRSKDGSCGVLVPSMEAKIINTDNGDILNVGEIGEILIRGPNIMKSYFNLPEATKNTIDKDGFLHTGDIGYFDDEDFLFITDRVKDLIKFKGFQVAPAELEGQLMQHPEIVDAAVIGKLDEDSGELPYAFIVKRSNSTLTEVDVHSFLNSRISPFKRLTGGISFVDSIPKSPTGKVLRRILRTQLENNT